MTKLLQQIRSTLAIDPAYYSAKVSTSRFASFGYALAGIIHMLRYAKNVRIQALATVIIFGVCLWLQLDRVEWAIMVVVIALNWFAEFVNAAIEAAVNLSSPEPHPMGQVAKDVAAGAVLLITLASVMVGLLLLAPPLWERLS